MQQQTDRTTALQFFRLVMDDASRHLHARTPLQDPNKLISEQALELTKMATSVAHSREK